MTTNDQLHSDGFPLIWDNTMRVQAAECPRKLYFFLRRFDYAHRPAYFAWGSAWGEILAEWYSEPEAIKDPRSEIYVAHAFSALKAGLDYWDSLGILDAGANRRDSLEKIWDAYRFEYPFEEWTLVEKGAEAGWVFPLPGTDWFLGGSLDGYIEWPNWGMLALEHKTAGDYLTDSYKLQWSFSGQVTGYIWVLTNILGEQNVAGCLMNLATKKIPGPRSKWTTPRFARTIERRSPIALKEYEEQFAFDIYRFKRDYWDRWYWPQTVFQNCCAGGVGKAPCAFKALCLSDADPTTIDISPYPNLVELEGKWEPWHREGSQS